MSWQNEANPGACHAAQSRLVGLLGWDGDVKRVPPNADRTRYLTPQNRIWPMTNPMVFNGTPEGDREKTRRLKDRPGADSQWRRILLVKVID